LISALALCCLLFAVAACQGERGSGTPATDSRSVSGFDEVEAQGVISLVVTVGPKHSCELSGDDNLLPLVEAKVDGSRLILRSDKQLRPDTPLVATVTMPDVKAVRISGKANGSIKGFDNHQLDLRLSGAGRIIASGKTNYLTLNLSGAGQADLQKVDAANVEIDVSGAGSVEVGSPTRLDVDISGAGSVLYSGSPELSEDISGAGTVARR
jgi:hypothetical protein